jgi:predicted nucleotidyltransferase
LHLPTLGIIIPNMGIKDPLSNLAAALFSSVQQRVLGLLFGRPYDTFSTSDVIRLVGSGTGAVHRELRRLAESGLVTVARVGNQKRYRANWDAPIFEELRGLILKTTGLAAPLQDALFKHQARIQAAFVYGSLAKGNDKSRSDVDLMILSDELTYPEIYMALQGAEKSLGRTIHPNLMSIGDWQRKLARKNAFATQVNDGPKLFVIGTEHDISGTAKPGEDRSAQGTAGQPKRV